MTVPRFVGRALLRLLLGGIAAALIASAAGFAAERARFGATPAAGRARVEAEVRDAFAAIGRGLDQAVQAARPNAVAMRLAEQSDRESLRALFDRASGGAAQVPLSGLAITIAGSTGAPIAWHGRPGELPDIRLMSGASLFLAPGPQGLRVVRIEPLLDAAVNNSRVGALVAEVPLTPGAGMSLGGDEYTLPTSLIPVGIRPRFEGGGDDSRQAFTVPGPDGEPLAAISIPDEALAAARAHFRARWQALALAVLLAALLLCTGPLLDWRRSITSIPLAAGVTLLIAAVLIAVRGLARVAVDAADLPGVALAPALRPGRISGWLLGSPVDFLLTSLVLGGLVALAGSSLALWRSSRRRLAGAIRVEGAPRQALFLAAHLLAGAAAGALVVGHEAVLLHGLSYAPIDLLRFGLRPWEWPRIQVLVGLIVLHAAVAALGVIVLRTALAPFVFPVSARAHRLRAALCWVAAGLAVLALGVRTAGTPPLPAGLALLFIAAAGWSVGAYRASLRHASQGVRLATFFLVVAVPSVVFYPSVVDAAGRARRQEVETRYAPEVQNQRRDLQLRLTSARAQIDRIAGIEDFVRAAEPNPQGPPSTDAAFRVWSETVLASQRLTSSVELYNGAGDLVSRFALKLPDIGAAQPWVETSCQWETFEEVSPFFAEERLLLHAGKALCVTDARGAQRRIGSLVVHVMLDYSNLPFISAQGPYVALLRAGRPEQEPAPARQPAGFTVYGWSRAVLYSSDRTAAPLTDDIFRQAYSTREPFWAATIQGDVAADVYVLNDRGAIYVLSLPRSTAVGHLVSLAELVTLVFVTFLLIVAGGMIFGLVAGRTPTSGRALLREVRASFSRKLFLAFVAASIVPVLALALVTRAYIATLMLDDIELEATRTAGVASRVAEDFSSLQSRGLSALPAIDDNVVVWLSRVIAEDVNIFAGADLLASSERNLFASGLLPTRTSGDVYRAILLEGRPSFVARETAAGFEYLVSAAPVRLQGQTAILTVPLTSRQQEVRGLIVELDRRVLLAALLLIMLGGGIGYSMAERIADPVNRLMRATRRLARGDFDARVLVTSSDELRRLVEAFNRMAEDLQRQRVELERTNRLAAWADMARQVAHDIKNPLTPIQLNAEHLQRVHADRGRPLGPVIDECVASILGQVRLLRQIAAEFSSFASAPQPKPAATDLVPLVTEIVNPYRAGLAGRIAIDVRMDDGLPPAMVDRLLIGRALTNIIENALHAMPATGTLTVGASAADGWVDLRVADSGVGMDAASLARIFEPYFSTKAIGTGLGLTIAKRNVEANGGSIAVESELGRGTTVTLRLPKAAAAAAV